MAYFAIGMGLYSDGSYEDVLSQLTDGLAWASGWREQYQLPGEVGHFFQARERLGVPAVGCVVREGRSSVGRGGYAGGRGWPDAGWSRSTGRAGCGG